MYFTLGESRGHNSLLVNSDKLLRIHLRVGSTIGLYNKGILPSFEIYQTRNVFKSVLWPTSTSGRQVYRLLWGITKIFGEGESRVICFPRPTRISRPDMFDGCFDDCARRVRRQRGIC